MDTTRKPVVDHRARIEMPEALARGIADLEAAMRRENERAGAVRRAIGEATKHLRHDPRIGAESQGFPQPPAWQPAPWSRSTENNDTVSTSPKLTLLRGGAGGEGIVDPPHHDRFDSAPSLAPRNDPARPSDPAPQAELFQGAVTLRFAEGSSARAVVEFLNALWQQPAFRVRQFNGAHAGRVTEASVELCQPVDLRETFAALPGVTAVAVQPEAGHGPVLRISLSDRAPASAVS